MNVTLHIDALVIEGLELTAGDRAALQAAFETELTRLITERGLSPALQGGGTYTTLPAAPMTMPVVGGARRLGQQIARSVYGGFRE